jgi:hypothetical protein
MHGAVRSSTALVIGALLSAWARRGHAEEAAAESMALEVDASTDARGCADASVLRARVAERLGRDPFTTAGEHGKLRVSFGRDKARGWTAEIGLFDSTEARIGARSLSHGGASCTPLVGSVVFTIAVLLEDLAPQEPPPRPAPPAPPPAAPPEPERIESPPAAPPPPTRTVRFDVAAGGAGALGAAPAASAGGELGVGIDVARLRLELGGRMFFPTTSSGDVAVRTRLVHGRMAPCWGIPLLAGCVVVDLGSVSGEAVGERVTASRLEAQFYAAAGIGILSRVFLVRDVLFLRGAIDLLSALTRAGFDIGEKRVWTVPVGSAAGTIALGVRLP